MPLLRMKASFRDGKTLITNQSHSNRSFIPKSVATYISRFASRAFIENVNHGRLMKLRLRIHTGTPEAGLFRKGVFQIESSISAQALCIFDAISTTVATYSPDCFKHNTTGSQVLMQAYKVLTQTTIPVNSQYQSIRASILGSIRG